MLSWLSSNDLSFPPLSRALRAPNGLLAAGGDLSPARLIAAYRHGCFPWYEDNQPLLWWSPDPRMVLYPAELHIGRSLHKTLRKGIYQVTFDQAFREVIQACAAPRNYTEQTWITHDMQNAYERLHQMGTAHSVEVWQQDTLVGGLYGVAIGRVFFGESMFTRASDASKVGFVHLVKHLQKAGLAMIDCQMYSHHLHKLGGRLIPREDFAEQLACATEQTLQGDPWPRR